jgi:flagellar motor switch protein FliG
MNNLAPIRKGRKMSGAQKSAILFLCLGEERGGAIMQQLEVAEIRQITSAISTMGEIDAAVVEGILEEFSIKVDHQGGVFGSIDAARGLLKEFLPDERVNELLAEYHADGSQNVWRDLEKLSEKQLVEFLQKEHNQTLAVILSRLKPDVSARILPLLGSERATNVVERMMRMDDLSSDAVQSIESSLRDDLLAKVGTGAEARIESQLVSIFNNLDEALFNSISSDIESRAPEQLKAIKQKMFVFEDLIKFTDVMVGKVIRELQGTTLPLALRGAKKDLRDHILSALPSRARGMLQEEMAAMGPVKTKDVKQAQAEVVETALELMKEGQIELADDSEEMLEAEA